MFQNLLHLEFEKRSQKELYFVQTIEQERDSSYVFIHFVVIHHWLKLSAIKEQNYSFVKITQILMQYELFRQFLGSNKIGTYSLAIVSQAHNIPLYVAAPLSTIDFKISDGSEIPIEERDTKETQKFSYIFLILLFDLRSKVLELSSIFNVVF